MNVFLEDELHLNNDYCYHYCCCCQYYCSDAFLLLFLLLIYALKLHQIGAFNFKNKFLTVEHAPDLPRYTMYKVHTP